MARCSLSNSSLVGVLLALFASCSGGCSPSGSPTSVSRATTAPAAATASPVIPKFTEVAQAEGLSFQYQHGGSGRFYYTEIMGGGGALADFDGDGWLDIYCVQGAPLPGYQGKADFRNRLYRNRGAQPGARFEDVTAVSGTEGLRTGKKVYGIGCATGDYDNDGDPDLFVTGYGGSLLYRNEGGMRFTEVSQAVGLRDTEYGASAAFFDYDNDGRLDLAVCEYVKYRLEGNAACVDPKGAKDYCQPEYFQPGQPRLYHNEGGGKFRDVTQGAGLTRTGRALGVVAGDVNEDGRPDLYFACDKTPGLLYINAGNGRFTEEGVTRGCALGSGGHAQSGMGVDLRDMDGDLKPDLVVTNYWYEPNSLFRNLGQGDFADVGAGAGLVTPNREHVSFGVGLEDFNNDGWPELLVTNGHVLTQTASATPGAERAQLDQLYLNESTPGTPHFREISAQAGPWFSHRHVGRGSAFGDVDNDGDIDVLTLTNEGPVALLRNDLAKSHWVRFRLKGTRSNRNGIGATVNVTSGGRTQRIPVRTARSYASASDVRVLAGLGSQERVERVEVKWPSGTTDHAEGLAGGREYVVTEGEGFR